ncbi:unnamed protein product [Candidula unifasciata]|uniref:UDP-glucuronosyltransferase n=1 Tax=Candidula unifasciata TaxID=100452 RepID=A0A8S3ZJJ9_9EUPU|nr:unnamed protein product [Candidula unifasciata]
MSVNRSIVTAALFATLSTLTLAKTVVFLPPPSTSYFVYHSNVAAALASRGHEVWICVPDFLLQKNLVKDKAVKVIPYGKQLGNIEERVMKHSRLIEVFWAEEFSINVVNLYHHNQEYSRLAHEILSDQTFINAIRNLKPDFFVLESIIFNVNMVVLPYILDTPFAFIGTFHDPPLTRVPFSPGAPDLPGEHMSNRLTFPERAVNLLFYLVRINFDLFHDSSLVSRFAAHKPYKSINDLAGDAKIFIAEIDHILDYPRLMLPNTKLVGGSSASVAKPLVGELKKFVDESKHGIVVVSFGGSVINVPSHITAKMAAAFRQLDLRVVWNVNLTSPDPSHIRTSLWMPQNDLLGHEKTKLFVSHCGKNGQYEALYHAVPILCLPIFGDQGYNAERIKIKQLGLRADIRKISADELATMIKEIVYKGNYSENMKKTSRLYRELYKDPKTESAYWLDHVMKYGGAYMRSAGQEMPWYQLYVLDVIAALLAVTSLILLFVYQLIKICYRCVRTQFSDRKRKQD